MVIIGFVIFVIVIWVVLSGDKFCLILCLMFLIIMMVLLIIILMVSIKLNNDKVLIDIFNYCIIVNVLIKDIGIVISGIIDVCYVCRNIMIMIIISVIVFSSVLIIVLIELCMKIVGL